jgi:predicted DNA-binding ribbon-helix-helix protein
MNTIVIKRSINVNGNKTSVSLENEFWDALHEIAESKNTTTAQLVGEIARQRTTVNLSSALRVYAFRHFRSLEGSRHLSSAILRARAGESRALAGGLKDQEVTNHILRIADDYEQMATLAARLERSAESD